MEHYNLAIVSLRYAKNMQVRSLAELLYTFLRKKIQTLKQISHCRSTSLAKLVCLPCFNLLLRQIKCLLAKENFDFLKN